MHPRRRERRCPAAKQIMLELAVDVALRTYQRTKSRKALVRLQDARREAMAG